MYRSLSLCLPRRHAPSRGPPAACMPWITTAILLATIGSHQGSRETMYSTLESEYERLAGPLFDFTQYEHHKTDDQVDKKFWRSRAASSSSVSHWE